MHRDAIFTQSLFGNAGGVDQGREFNQEQKEKRKKKEKEPLCGDHA